MYMSHFKAGIGLVLLLFGSSKAQERAGVDPGMAAPIVASAFSLEHLSGSLEYWGRCNYNPDFPKVHPPVKNVGTVVATLHDVFQDDPEMQISQGAHGLIRMIEKDVPQDILNIKIAHVSFGMEVGSMVYDLGPKSAIQAILQSAEVRDFMKANNLDLIQEPGFVGGIISGSAPPVRELSEVTVSQAMDKVIQMYHGFWVYENCQTEKGRKVRLAFFSIH